MLLRVIWNLTTNTQTLQENIQRQVTTQNQSNTRNTKIKRLENKVVSLTAKLEAANLLTAEAKAALQPHEGIELAVALML